MILRVRDNPPPGSDTATGSKIAYGVLRRWLAGRHGPSPPLPMGRQLPHAERDAPRGDGDHVVTDRATRATAAPSQTGRIRGRGLPYPTAGAGKDPPVTESPTATTAPWGSGAQAPRQIRESRRSALSADRGHPETSPRSGSN